jgi:leader peptidase (prepilin peptidase)/N-methyltransferase
MLIAFIFGLPIGSFLNVVIWRLPREENIAFPPSHCPVCNAKIRPYDNIPVVSYLILRGECRDCGARISARYPIVEFVTACLFAAAWPLAGGFLGWDFAAAIIMTGLGVAITGIDIDHKIIPDELSIGGLVVALILAPLRAGDWRGLLYAALAAAFGAVLLLLVRLIGSAILKKEAMGLGDVKLIAMIGAFTGWQNVLLTIFLASLIGTIGGIIAIARSKKMRKERLIPFGPFLMAAGLISFYFGDSIIRWYLVIFLAGG